MRTRKMSQILVPDDPFCNRRAESACDVLFVFGPQGGAGIRDKGDGQHYDARLSATRLRGRSDRRRIAATPGETNAQ